MSYVSDHLLPGEHVVHRTHLHWVIFRWSLLVAVLAVAAAVGLQLIHVPPDDTIWQLIVPAGLIVLAGLLAIGPIIRRSASEYAVTDKRVIVKRGVIQRDSLETLLTKVEAIGVDQTLAGRMLGFGTITIVGTGGTRETFDRIAAPLEFRRQVQSQIVVNEDRRMVPAGEPLPAAGRVERECPYCAERILARAQVCRFCDRAVTPLE